MKRPNTITAVLLIAAPALVLGWGAARQLRDDIVRGDRFMDEVLVDGKIVAPLQSVVEQAKLAAQRAVESLPLSATADEFAAVAQTNAVVRNVFSWKSGEIEYPLEKGATQEERRFRDRYVTLFDDGFKDPVDEMGQRIPSASSFTWRTWYEGDRLSFIGWMRQGDGEVRGVELETVKVLSEFLSVIKRNLPNGLAVELRDGFGKCVVRTRAHRPEEMSPELALDIGLPGYTLAVWRVVPRSHALRYLTTLLPPFLALVLGGVLLVLEITRERRESMLKTGFVSNVSHELKTPLTAVRLSAEMLREGRVKEEAQARYLEVIVRESERLTRLVDNVLDFGRLERGRRKFNLEARDVNELLSVAEAQRPRVEAAGLTLMVRSAPMPVMRTFDLDAVGQVLVNLIDNAVKYAASGKMVEVSVSERGEITVADRGPGIAAKHRSRIFERFYRCDDSITAKSSGSGLGLSIASRLMAGMGGKLVFAPRAGGGAVFTIKFGEKA
ncbi:MAG: sensor histidine kinase [Kiritimatiellia bacterium]